MQRKRHLVAVLVIGIRIIRNIEPQRLIRRHHRKRFVMNVAGYAPLRHSDDDIVPLGDIPPQQTHDIKVSARRMIRSIMHEHLNRTIFQRFVIAADQLAATAQHFRITLQLRQSDPGHNVRHVAFEIGRDDIVLPSAELRLGQSVLTLSMKRQQLELLVEPFVIDTGNRTPRKRPAFGRREVLDGMEREGGEVGAESRYRGGTGCVSARRRRTPCRNRK